MLAASAFVAMLGMGAQGYFGNQGRGFNVPWLTSVLSAVAAVTMAGAVAGYLLGDDTLSFEAEVRAMDDPNREYEGWKPSW